MLKSYEKNSQWRILNAWNPKWVSDVMGINIGRFKTCISRELNRLRKSAQLANKRFYKIRSIDQAVSC